MYDRAYAAAWDAACAQAYRKTADASYSGDDQPEDAPAEAADAIAQCRKVNPGNGDASSPNRRRLREGVTAEARRTALADVCTYAFDDDNLNFENFINNGVYVYDKAPCPY